ncbi:hypothetical protein [Bacillus alkalisoli]|uniref:hypothetical protein n=1 Tax=Bacillus alkalisoli TaxID=2011008 RepID=UPI000C24AE48|nr:hypothetical protein [Bacillus alkalisoli]
MKKISFILILTFSSFSLIFQTSNINIGVNTKKVYNHLYDFDYVISMESPINSLNLIQQEKKEGIKVKNAVHSFYVLFSPVTFIITENVEHNLLYRMCLTPIYYEGGYLSLTFNIITSKN